MSRQSIYCCALLTKSNLIFYEGDEGSGECCIQDLSKKILTTASANAFKVTLSFFIGLAKP